MSAYLIAYAAGVLGATVFYGFCIGYASGATKKRDFWGVILLALIWPLSLPASLALVIGEIIGEKKQ